MNGKAMVAAALVVGAAATAAADEQTIRRVVGASLSGGTIVSVQRLVKQDAIPGFIRDTWFRADKIGTYRGQCAELCGKDHVFMPIVVLDGAVLERFGVRPAREALVIPG